MINYRIIALDVDGTLINDLHEVTPRVRKAVRRAAERGAEIVLCTGRGSTSALPVLDELGLQGTMITHNGASIVDSLTKTAIGETGIPPGPASRYLRFARERGIHYDMNTAFDLYVHGKVDDEIEAMYERMHAKPIVRSGEEPLPEGLVKISLFASKEALDEAEAAWSGWKHELQTVRSGDFFIDVQHPLASKGEALRRLAEMRGVPREQVLAIGNYHNDIGMLEFAGLGVAMANSPDGVKGVADALTASNNEDGVALALERHVLA